LLATCGSAEETVVPERSGPYEVFSWLSAGQPFYLIGMRPHQKVKWSSKISVYQTLHLASAHKEPSGAAEVYTFPGWSAIHDKWRWSSVKFCVKVLSGSVTGHFKVGTVNIAELAEADAVSEFEEYDSESGDTTRYWRFNGKNAPSPRVFDEGWFTSEGYGEIQLGKGLPEFLEIKFENDSATTIDAVVACYLLFSSDNGLSYRYAELGVEGNYQGGLWYKTVWEEQGLRSVTVIQCGSGDVLASGTPEAESKIGGTVVGGRFSEIRQRFQMDWLRDGLNGTAGPLFKVENLTLGNMRFENTSGASMGFEIEVGKVLDSWKWDEATLRQMGLWDGLQALRLAMLFVFMYYTWLHFWKEFNR
jgi:hypothetical protein